MSKKELVTVIRFLHSKGYAPATSSNYSFREPNDSNIWVSASGIDKGDFAEKDLIYINLKGKPIDPEEKRKTSAETDLHTVLYLLFPQTGCVLHTHTVMNTVLSRSIWADRQKAIFNPQPSIRLENYELLKIFEGINTHDTIVDIPIFNNTQDIPALAEEIANYAEAHPDMKAFLIAGHGMYTWASTIAIAKGQVETIEFLLECEFQLRLLQKS